MLIKYLLWVVVKKLTPTILILSIYVLSIIVSFAKLNPMLSLIHPHIRGLNKILKHSKLLKYEGIGHALHWEDPQRFAKDLNEFLNGLQSSF